MGEMLQDAYERLSADLSDKKSEDLSVRDISCLFDYIDMVHGFFPRIDNSDISKLITKE